MVCRLPWKATEINDSEAEKMTQTAQKQTFRELFDEFRNKTRKAGTPPERVEDVAKRVGIGKGLLYALLRGKHASVWMLERLAQKLGIPLDKLKGAIPAPPP